MKQYMTNGINPSPTISVPISDTAFGSGVTELTELGGKAVKFAADGGAVLCSAAGESVLGIVTIDNDVTVSKGDNISIQIKDNGLAKVGGTVAAGDELATDTNGLFVKATSGQYVRAIALASGSANGIVRVIMANYVKA